MISNKIMLAAVGTIATAGLLFSFTGGDDDIKMKRYHVWHQENGEKIEFDTLIPMDSDFTVKDFLATRGIDESNVRIIDMSACKPGGPRPHGGPGHHKEVDIKVEVDENGNKTITKTEDGQTETMTEDAFNEWKSQQPKHSRGRKHIMRKHEGDEGMEFILSESDDRVEIKMVVDEDGNVETKKWVNGEEVAMNDEEIKAYERAKGGKKIMFIESEADFDGTDGEGAEQVDINVEVDADGNKTITKTVNGVSTTITEEELKEMDHKAGKNCVRIIELDEAQTWTTEDGEGKNEVVEIKVTKDENGNLIKTKTVNGEPVPFTDEELKRIERHAKGEGNVVRHEKRHKKHGDDHQRMEVRERIEHRVISTDTDEDYTIVLVESRLNADGKPAKTSRNLEEMRIYPNPNEGKFTVSFNQKDAADIKIEVVDLNGKSVYQDALSQFKGTYNKEIDLSRNGAGTYIVNLRRGDELNTQKIIVE